MDNQLKTVFDNSDGVTLLGGGGKGGKSGGSASKGLARIDPNAPVSARVANATSSTGNLITHATH